MAVVCLLLFVGRNSFAQQLVMPGDHPDPSVVKIGDTYWASATTSNWMPAFPLMKSTDLLHWQTVGHVFPQLPEWADYYFWAPEFSYDNGKVYVYYSAHKKGGNLCVGIASADRAEGPYKDHGPILCQQAGSIDAFPMRDENGKLYLLWKEDGNSIGQPTPIWMQELNEERTKVLGEKQELFRNDAPWEGNLVEGVSMMRHGGYIYAFYAAAGCCGGGCTYQSGIARATKLAGPWEKFPGNPVLMNEGPWKCPGHGTPVEKDGRFYFLYHAYDSTGTVYTGRQGLLREFEFTADNWVRFKPGANVISMPPITEGDKFDGGTLAFPWQWSVTEPVNYRVESGALFLNVTSATSPSFLGRKTMSTDYRVSAKLKRRSSTAAAGLALVGDGKNAVGVFLRANDLQVVQTRTGNDSVLYSVQVPQSKTAWLAMDVSNGKDISFSIGRKQKRLKKLALPNIAAPWLPPWDRALRVALAAKGNPGETAVFDEFVISPK